MVESKRAPSLSPVAALLSIFLAEVLQKFYLLCSSHRGRSSCGFSLGNTSCRVKLFVDVFLNQFRTLLEFFHAQIFYFSKACVYSHAHCFCSNPMCCTEGHTFKGLPFFYPIHHAEGLAVALELVFGAIQEVADFDVGTLVFCVGTFEDLLQSG